MIAVRKVSKAAEEPSSRTPIILLTGRTSKGRLSAGSRVASTEAVISLNTACAGARQIKADRAFGRRASFMSLRVRGGRFGLRRRFVDRPNAGIEWGGAQCVVREKVRTRPNTTRGFR